MLSTIGWIVICMAIPGVCLLIAQGIWFVFGPWLEPLLDRIFTA